MIVQNPTPPPPGECTDCGSKATKSGPDGEPMCGECLELMEDR